MKRIALIALIAGAAWFYVSRTAAPVVHNAPAAIAFHAGSEAEAPRQRDPQPNAFFEVNGYELRTLQAFAIKARVLGVEHYRSGRESDLSPTDLALGWGRMADPRVSDQLSISQSARWYHWRHAGKPPIPTREIEISSANMHMIPANGEVARALSALEKGRVVSLRGYLVEAQGRDGWSWRSSLTREDTGAGACELVFVQAIEVH
jgi:hypothetical protein